MKIKLFQILSLLFALLWIMYSCSTTKYVAENESLLNTATVKVDAKDITYFDLEPYIKQKNNFKTFEVFRLPLFLYNLSGTDTTRWYNRVLKNAGEAPILYDSTQVDKTIIELSRVMQNKGYLEAKIDPIIIEKKRKIDVTYDIVSGTPTRVDNYTINVSDSAFSSNIIHNSFRMPRRMRIALGDSSRVDLNRYLNFGSLIKKGDQFDLDLLDRERDRITSILKRNGYMNFDKKYIGFIADTLDKKNEVNLELVISPYVLNTGNNQTIEQAHKQYTIDKVDIYVDYNPIADGNIGAYIASDTIRRGKYNIFYGKRGEYLKPYVILENCYIRAGSLYNDNLTNITYNSLSQLHILKNVNIRYDEYLENDSIKLACIITGVPDKKQGISAEIEGTNSAGYLGVGAGLGYVHRNIFKGSELFNAKLRGAYEAVTPNFSSFKDNYFEIGAETSITFPRFMFPLLSYDLRRKLRASTQLVSSYTYQRRPNFFTRTVFSTGVKYIWENRGSSTTRHTLDLIDISYAHLPKLDPTFASKLSENARIYSFTDQFITSIGYTYSRSNVINNLLNTTSRRNRNTYSFRGSVETAGNVLSLIGSLADLPKEENGSRKIFDTYFAQYIRGNFDYSRSILIDDRSSFAWRIGAGIAYPYGNNKLVPFQKRFFSGGANSVRGWNARELGPGSFYRIDANFNDQSGDIRFDANIEYRTKAFWKLELAAFLDAGNIWTIKGTDRQYGGEFKVDRFYKQIASAWGLGFRFDFDFVLIRLDVGWKLYDPANIPNLKKDSSGYDVVDGYKSKWSVLKPLNIRDNTTWHIAVGYPF